MASERSEFTVTESFETSYGIQKSPFAGWV